MTFAAKFPDKLRELQELFWVEAAKYQVLPLDASVATRLVAPRPNITAGRTAFTYSGELTGIPHGDAPSILNASYTITADVDIPEGGAEGMLHTNGGRFGGYGFYLLKGQAGLRLEPPRFEANPLGGAGSAFARQAHAGVRLQVRRTWLRNPGLQ